MALVLSPESCLWHLILAYFSLTASAEPHLLEYLAVLKTFGAQLYRLFPPARLARLVQVSHS